MAGKIWADKGYVSNEFSDRFLCSTKGSPMKLSEFKNEKNAQISSKRVLIENYFGRLKNKFEIMNGRYRSYRDKYNTFFKNCCSLVNFDIMECGNFLRQEDG